MADATRPRLPFDVEFQKSLLRLVIEDQSFGYAATKHLAPEFFESEILAWMYRCVQQHQETYDTIPSLPVLMEAAKGVGQANYPIYAAMVEQVGQASLRDHVWLRDQVLDFAKRNIFVRAFQDSKELYNAGKVDEAYDVMMARMDEVATTTWDPVDRTWFYLDLQQRQTMRHQRAQFGDAISTGFPWLDAILRGGLHLGELGVWMTYPKIGKTTMLITLAIAGVRRGFKVLIVVLEGSRKLIEDRCDSAFLQEVYADVKSGNINAHKYSLAIKEYRLLQDSLVIRSFVEKFDITILDIDHELRDLERNHGWRPHLLCVDYADLMTGRHQTQYRSTTESQRAAYKDCKRLTNQDYAMWTAAQAQRPKKDAFENPHILKSDAAADTYDKVRVCDFWGSLNQTTIEKKNKVIRAHAELYRDNEADQTVTLGCDLTYMQIWQHPNATNFDASSTVTPALGYTGPGQRTAF